MINENNLQAQESYKYENQLQKYEAEIRQRISAQLEAQVQIEAFKQKLEERDKREEQLNSKIDDLYL